ncbi:MAG: toxin-antitoxin system YwqK family antitoxin [Fibrobacter sp.]|nr:toxin-antitoxin system YwqK family antitoxin [Fibrobacter sp.]
MKNVVYVVAFLVMVASAFAEDALPVAVPTNDPCLADGADSALVASGEYEQVKSYFADSTLARCYIVKKGTDIREGRALSFHPNGNLAVEAPYKEGKLEGVLRTFFENGKMWQTTGYMDGIEEGPSVTYYESGVKKSKDIYKDGVLEGLSEEWTERGTIKRKIPYVKGSIHGKALSYDELGALKEEMTFEHGIRHGTYRRFNKGVKVFEAEFVSNRCVKNCYF